MSVPPKSSVRKVFLLAAPMVLSNITVPLLGMVDTAVIGHLHDPAFLGGVATGNTVFMAIVWLCGFLRMSTTGLTAQAYGAGKAEQQGRVLAEGLVVALAIGLLVLVLHPLLFPILLPLIGASDAVTTQAAIYLQIRCWALPATLANMALVGWFVGRQQTTMAMAMMIIANVVNIILDVLLVSVWHWQVAGAAWASVAGDYLSLVVAGSLLAYRHWLGHVIKAMAKAIKQWRTLADMMRLNGNILVRSLALQSCLAFMTFYSARLGDLVVAANAVLLNLFMMISYALDGFAYAAESMVGAAWGKQDRQRFRIALYSNIGWTAALAAGFSVGLAVAGPALISVLTDLADVKHQANQFLPYLIALPWLAAGCFLLDGIFVGLTAAKTMRNNMLVAAFVVFFPVWALLHTFGNHALWIAFLALMLARSVGLAWALFRFMKRWQYSSPAQAL